MGAMKNLWSWLDRNFCKCRLLGLAVSRFAISNCSRWVSRDFVSSVSLLDLSAGRSESLTQEEVIESRYFVGTGDLKNELFVGY